MSSTKSYFCPALAKSFIDFRDKNICYFFHFGLRMSITFLQHTPGLLSFLPLYSNETTDLYRKIKIIFLSTLYFVAFAIYLYVHIIHVKKAVLILCRVCWEVAHWNHNTRCWVLESWRRTSYLTFRLCHMYDHIIHIVKPVVVKYALLHIYIRFLCFESKENIAWEYVYYRHHMKLHNVMYIINSN